jgi:hypothetical protein
MKLRNPFRSKKIKALERVEDQLAKEFCSDFATFETTNIKDAAYLNIPSLGIKSLCFTLADKTSVVDHNKSSVITSIDGVVCENPVDLSLQESDILGAVQGLVKKIVLDELTKQDNLFKASRNHSRPLNEALITNATNRNLRAMYAGAQKQEQSYDLPEGFSLRVTVLANASSTADFSKAVGLCLRSIINNSEFGVRRGKSDVFPNASYYTGPEAEALAHTLLEREAMLKHCQPVIKKINETKTSIALRCPNNVVESDGRRFILVPANQPNPMEGSALLFEKDELGYMTATYCYKGQRFETVNESNALNDYLEGRVPTYNTPVCASVSKVNIDTEYSRDSSRKILGFKVTFGNSQKVTAPYVLHEREVAL